jgi:hypothetical protein
MPRHNTVTMIIIASNTHLLLMNRFISSEGSDKILRGFMYKHIKLNYFNLLNFKIAASIKLEFLSLPPAG